MLTSVFQKVTRTAVADRRLFPITFRRYVRATRVELARKLFIWLRRVIGVWGITLYCAALSVMRSSTVRKKIPLYCLDDVYYNSL